MVVERALLCVCVRERNTKSEWEYVVFEVQMMFECSRPQTEMNVQSCERPVGGDTHCGHQTGTGDLSETGRQEQHEALRHKHDGAAGGYG